MPKNRPHSRTRTHDTNYAVAPGAMLDEWAEEEQIPLAELGPMLGFDAKDLDLLLRGRIELTQDTAQRLDRTTNIPARLWLRMERTYRQDLARLGPPPTHPTP